MLLLTFRVADNRYAVDSRRVVEVTPRIELRRVPHAPDFLVGLFNYRGGVVPVIDLGLLLGGAECRSCLSTRIILVETTVERGKGRLGLVAEQVSDVRAVRDDQVVFPPMPLEHAPYLGSILELEDGLVQMLAVDQVLSEPLRSAVFGLRTESS